MVEGKSVDSVLDLVEIAQAREAVDVPQGGNCTSRYVDSISAGVVLGER